MVAQSHGMSAVAYWSPGPEAPSVAALAFSAWETQLKVVPDTPCSFMVGGMMPLVPQSLLCSTTCEMDPCVCTCILVATQMDSIRVVALSRTPLELIPIDETWTSFLRLKRSTGPSSCICKPEDGRDPRHYPSEGFTLEGYIYFEGDTAIIVHCSASLFNFWK